MPSSPITVLVTSAGAASGVSVIKALRLQREISVRIIACDANDLAAGLYLADERAIIPGSSDSRYLDALLALCREQGVIAVFPIHSSEIEVLAEHAAVLRTNGVATLLPSLKAVRHCNDKAQAVAFVRSLGVPVPEILEASDPSSFPVFVKLRTGSGSTDARRVDTAEDLNYSLARQPELLVQQFVAGSEFTVDALCDRNSRLIAASPRERLAVRSGQCVKGVTVAAPELIETCAQLVRKFEIIGPCNLQFIMREKQFVFIELNPRYAAGGLMLTVRAGANLPLLALKLMLDRPIQLHETTVKHGIRMIRYWEEIFLPD